MLNIYMLPWVNLDRALQPHVVYKCRTSGDPSATLSTASKYPIPGGRLMESTVASIVILKI